MFVLTVSADVSSNC